MIAGLARAFDNLFGRGEAAVTVPPLDGMMRPNRALDEATDRIKLVGVDCLAVFGDTLVASVESALLELVPNGRWVCRSTFDSPVTCISPLKDGIAAALANGDILIMGGDHDGRRYHLGPGVASVTAMSHGDGALFIAKGSDNNGAEAWQRDLLDRNASGSIWRIDLESGSSARIAEGLAWPAGIVHDGSALVVSEAWRHRLVRIDSTRSGRRDILNNDLPGYPGRIVPATGGFWLAMFAPRSQLVEFVLREPTYRKRMMAEVPQAYWVAPRLRSGRSFHESLQGGGVKHLGMLKPWAPTMSAGLCVRLDRKFQPLSSLQSRADGNTHGVTGVAEHRGRVFIAARGDGVIVSLPLEPTAADREAADDADR